MAQLLHPFLRAIAAAAARRDTERRLQLQRVFALFDLDGSGSISKVSNADAWHCSALLTLRGVQAELLLLGGARTTLGQVYHMHHVSCRLTGVYSGSGSGVNNATGGCWSTWTRTRTE